jgi:hypothetical protein
MSVLISQFLKEKKLPDFIASNKSLLACEKVGKVFPGIGLPNCSEDTDLGNVDDVKLLARNLIGEIHSKLYYLPHTIQGKYELANLLYHSPSHFIIVDNGKTSLKLPQDIVSQSSGKILFKKGESFFKVYGQMYKDCGSEYKNHCDINNSPSFKRFSAANVTNKKLKIVFSSSGIEGLWDIATMSMRGFRTCQSWDGQYRSNLIGSILDPFTGIIYLTSGSQVEDYGSNMIRRCIVRFFVSTTDSRPHILIDRMYPEYNDHVWKKFANFIKTKTDGKFEIHNYHANSGDLQRSAYIPKTNNIATLYKVNLPFRDLKLQIGKPKSLDKEIVLKNKLALKNAKLLRLLNKSSLNSFDGYIKQLDKTSSLYSIIKQPDFKFLLNDYYKSVGRKVIKNLPINGKECTPGEYYIKLLYSFILSKKDIESSQLTKLTKTLNSYFSLGKKKKLNSKQIKPILLEMNKDVGSSLKAELKKSIVKSIKEDKSKLKP